MRERHEAVWDAIAKGDALSTARQIHLDNVSRFWYAQRRDKELHAAHNGHWYDDEVDLHFQFSWRDLQPFGKALAHDNLEERGVQRRRRKFQMMEEIAHGQRQHDELLREAVKQLKSAPVA